MTTIPSLLDELARDGIKLKLIGDGRIEVTAHRGRLSDDLRARIGRHKPELVEWLAKLRTDRPQDTALPVITPDPDRLFEPFPPSDLQASFLIGSREGFEYYVRPHQYFEYELGETDPRRLEQALNEELHHQRHNLVVVRDDMRLETVRDPAPAELRVYDLRGLPLADAERAMARMRDAIVRTEPVHDRWPWVDLRLSLLPGGRSRLHFNNNNIFSDAPATLRFLDRVLLRYRDPHWSPPALEISFRDCVLALAELEESPLGQASRAYWTDRIADWPEAPPVPLAAGADPRRRSRLERREMLFPAPVWTALRDRAAARNLTTTNVLSAVQAEVLSYWSGSRHFLLNNMITHRLPLHPQLPDVLGNFASLYPLEVDWRPDEPFQARVRRLQARMLSDVEHLYWSGVKVLQKLNQARRTPGRAVCPFAIGSALFVGQQERPVHSQLETPQTLIDCEFWDLRDGSLWVVWDVIEDMFPEGLIDAMEQGYRTVVTELAESDAAWETKAFELLPATQREQRARINRTSPPLPGGLLHTPLERHAAERPDRPAVVADGATVGYRELHRRAARLAETLHAQGTRPGDLVALVLSKGPEQITAVHGVLTAGAAYVPLDPAWPEDRIRYVLSDTSATAVVTVEGLRERLTGLTQAPVVTVDGVTVDGVTVDGVTVAEPAPAPAPAARAPEDLAYVIYTSGSTGRPKGAMLDHRGPLNTIAEVNRRFGITGDDVLFGISSLCFDLSVYDIFGALQAGATLVLPERGEADPAAWVAAVRRHGVTVWNSVPAIMQLFVEEAEAAGLECPSLRTVLLSGDWIPVGLPDRIRGIAPNAQVVSLGGATEASIWSICHPVGKTDPGWTSIPYGKPLAGQSWYILDELGRDLPTWVAGQLYIGGAGLALGYLGDPDRTAAAFTTHPRTGERLYRTGDLGRYLPGGEIEFLGRADFQVKIQGFRVEPGEVEHALAELPHIGQAAVVARTTDSGKQLAAFATAAEGVEPPSAATVLAALGERLPAYMVPSHLTVLERLPLTANGKLDRRALEALEPAGPGGQRERTAPRTPAEKALAEIWEAVLGSGPIGVHDDFFALGGQSFTALRVTAQIARRLGHQVPLGTLLERRTVAGLAEWLETRADWSPLVRLRDGDADPWFFVHPAGGNVLCYRALAESLGRPFHAFQAPGAAGGSPLETMDDLTALYTRELRRVQPSGPYRLGGWSSGAVIAAGIAHRLEALGEKVERLVVIDAPAPVEPREVDEAQLALWFLEDLDIGFDPRSAAADLLRERLAALPEGTFARLAPPLLHQAAGAAGGLDAADLADALAVFRGVVRACNSHRAAGLAADITVVRARDGQVGEFADHPCAAAPDWGWAALTTGRTATASVPGTHHTLLTSPLVAAVSAAIDRHPEEDAPR
ncbi:non-ribosomal peptide synthetase [Peterkaempfera bronchialis]|uniref:Amino acid adenylation domain-containing protein n=1 Tax=Peterkaempfera bronchialis TaxID=2126346 RepID=A0A345T293_9ACTN|nr:non-ribosomal peptide synthetase [Peterkaempfera bronchialis]AXI80098.1 amino acid adenylation domain-containing protein [Peterkaempfera bronchialis]